MSIAYDVKFWMRQPLDYEVYTPMRYETYSVLHGRIVLEDFKDFLEWRQASGPTVEVTEINVSNEHRRQGKGKRLIGLLIRDLLPPGTRTVWAITRADNFPAQHLYESMRWRVVGVLRNFYADGPMPAVPTPGTVDAVMYGWDIGSQV